MRPFSTPLGRWLGVLALAALFATPALAQRTVTLRMNSATLADTIKADTEGKPQPTPQRLGGSLISQGESSHVYTSVRGPEPAPI